jgi:hypothetical protein
MLNKNISALMLIAALLAATNANADYVLTKDAPESGFDSMFTLTVTLAGKGENTAISGINSSDDGLTVALTTGGRSFTLSGLGDLDFDLKYLKFDGGNSVKIATPFSVAVNNGTAVQVTNGSGIQSDSGNTYPYYLMFGDLESLIESFTLSWNAANGNNAGTFTITGYGNAAAAPEPATMLMFGLGIAGVAVARRIRRK